MSVKSAQKHFRSVFEQHKNYPKKFKLKKLKNGAKRNQGKKESNISLGSWLAFWAANMICTSMLDITLILERKNYCMQAKDFTENAMQKLMPDLFKMDEQCLLDLIYSKIENYI